jgi:micrococcal nuclease
MRLTKNIFTAAAAIALALTLTGCQFTAGDAKPTDKAPAAVQEDTFQATEAPVIPEDAEGLVVKLVRVIDGDTVAVEPNEEFPANNDAGTEHSMRLLGIDAPEMNKMSEEAPECGAEEATSYLEGLLNVSSGTVYVQVIFDAQADKVDRYDRSLAYVELTTEQGGDVAQAMVADGFAEAWYPEGEPEPSRFAGYAEAEAAAIASGAGQHAVCDTIGR